MCWDCREAQIDQSVCVSQNVCTMVHGNANLVAESDAANDGDRDGHHWFRRCRGNEFCSGTK